MLPVMLSLVVARALGAAIESQQTLTEAPTTCKPGYVMVNNECKEYCSAMGVITGRCDPNCVRFQDDVCTACVGKFHIKEGVCVRLLWISDEETLVGDSDTEHVCALVPGQGGWQLVPGTNWIWDLNIGRTGTFLFTDQFVFDPWLQTRMTRVSLDVSVDDYYRIVFNGKTLVEKAGGSGQAPISYDVTNFVRKEATSFNPNLLEIHATNTGGVAGLSYKLVVHQNCPEGSDDVEGACVCKNGWIQRGETCVQTAWISGTNTKVGDGVGYAAVLVQQQAGWQAVTGAPWVWDTTIGKVGTFRFVDTIVLSEWLKTKFIGASITVGVDDYFRIVFNGQTITNQAGTPVGAPITYDLTQYFRVGATATNPNVLQIFATNTGGFGGLAYKVVIHQKCQENAEDIDGVCMCKWGYAQVNDGCTQVIWTSGTNTKVGEYNKVPSVLVNPYGPWQSIPKAPWIWHADINKIGTFTFTDSIYLGPWLRYNTASVDITLSVDDFYQIVLNGQLIVEKAGAPNAAPLTFDLTPYFRTNATATDPNILKITATNNAVYGGLAYKLTVHMKCASGADEIDGKCECNPGFAKVGDRCVQTAWRSDCPETMVSTSFRPSIVVPLIPGYQSVAGAAWIWDQISTKPGTVLFKNSLVLVDWIRPRMERATLEVSCDDNYRITLNGQVVTEKTGVWNNPPVTYDITSFLKFNAGTNIPRKNDLLVEATNIGWYGGLTYKLKITLKCPAGAEEVNDACQCKTGYAKWEGECVQLAWVSSTDTLVGDAELEHSILKVPELGGWKLVPGSAWVWDTNKDKVGTFRFSTPVVFTDWVKARLSSVSLDLSVDDYCKIVFNGKVVAEKVGAPFQAPISYDLTQFLSASSNLLEIHATNIGWPGGLSYKLVAHLKCQANADDVDGVCVCKFGFVNIGEQCVQVAWVSGPNTKLGEGYATYPAVLVQPQGYWKPVENAPWIWDTNTNKVGTFRFFENIVVPNVLKSKVQQVTITLSVDDYYRVVLNGHTVTEKSGGATENPITFDVTQYFKVGATAADPNLLEIYATNTAGFAGLSYKLILRQKCTANAEDVDGICTCKFGYSMVGGLCYQVIWVSNANTKVGEGMGLNSVEIVPYVVWQSVPGAPWIWDTNTSKLGTFRFVERIVVSPVIASKVASVSITLSCDDYYKLVFNGQTITEMAGAFNIAPISFDLTPYFKAGATDANPNVLQVWGTNNVGLGGLAYKLVVHQQCAAGAEDIDGTCRCKSGFQRVGDACIQVAWYSGLDTQASISTRNAISVPPLAEYKPVADANWIWDTLNSKVGVMTFVDQFKLTSRVLSRMEKAVLEVSVDDYARISFNGKIVTEKGGVWFEPPITYDVTNLIAFPNGQPYQVNELRIQATNVGGPGALSYKFRIIQKCGFGMEDVKGTCQCKWNYAPIRGTCVQTAWVSDPDTLIGDINKQSSVIVPVSSSWKVVPKANWIWNIDINKVGTFNFYDSISLPAWMQTIVTSATITISVDDYFGLRVNDKLIVERAGVSLGPPITYDITSGLKFSDLPSVTNNFFIAATNTGGVGCLSYKIAVHQKCRTGEEDADGVCVCKSGWVKLDDVCTQLEWISSKQTMVGEGINARAATEVATQGAWIVVPDAKWIWDTDVNNVGTFTFTDTFTVSNRFERNLASATLLVTVDDYYKIMFNDRVIVERAGVYGSLPLSYDLSPYILFSDPFNLQKNVLKITATSTGWWGGLSYKLTIKLLRN